MAGRGRSSAGACDPPSLAPQHTDALSWKRPASAGWSDVRSGGAAQIDKLKIIDAVIIFPVFDGDRKIALQYRYSTEPNVST